MKGMVLNRFFEAQGLLRAIVLSGEHKIENGLLMVDTERRQI
jgi:hypothetical protein